MNSRRRRISQGLSFVLSPLHCKRERRSVSFYAAGICGFIIRNSRESRILGQSVHEAADHLSDI